jgi:hypothetical protein
VFQELAAIQRRRWPRSTAAKDSSAESTKGVCVSLDESHLQPAKELNRKLHDTVEDLSAPRPEPPAGQLRKENDVATPPLGNLSNQSNQSPAHVSMLVNGTSGTGTDTTAAYKGVAKAEPASTLVDVEAASLWQEAYKRLVEDDPDLIRDLETIIMEDAGLDWKSDIKSEMQTVVKQQKTKMESKQWSFHLLGVKEVKVRETVDSILSLIDRSQGLISAGMTFAPVYISIPWTAVSSLIPVSSPWPFQN